VSRETWRSVLQPIVPLFPSYWPRELRPTEDQLLFIPMACIGATSYHTVVTQPLRVVRNQKPGH